MSARRQIIAALSEDSMGGIATLHDVAHAEQLVDAHRTEVIAKAIGRLRAIPVTCTALTGPVWYGDGWNSAITQLEEIADYQTPDDEAFPGELERLRTLALQLRVAAIRKNDLAEVQRLLAIYEETRKAATASASSATPDFFQPGHTYAREHHAATIRFLVKNVDTSPDGFHRVAFGWSVEDGDVTWSPFDSDDMGGWTDVTEGGAA
jgi:hypothetical protein